MYDTLAEPFGRAGPPPELRTIPPATNVLLPGAYWCVNTADPVGWAAFRPLHRPCSDTPYQMYSITIQTQYMYCTFGYLAAAAAPPLACRLCGVRFPVRDAVRIPCASGRTGCL
jgi:hypothetical protein